MTLLPLTLGVRSAPDTEGSSLKSQTDKVLKRDGFACRFCGFPSLKYQRVVPHPAAGTPALATACGFCEQCLSLDRIGTTGVGVLIWLPEMNQAALNHIARAAYVGRLEGKKLAGVNEHASQAINALTARRSEAKKRLGSDDPLLLATVLRESLKPKEREAVAA